MATDLPRTSHGYAVYSQHLVANSNLANDFDQQERMNEGGMENVKFNEDSRSYRLSLLSSNIQVDRETLLRAFLTKHLGRMQLLDGSGNVVSIAAGDVYEESSMAYFYFMPEQNSDSKMEDEMKNEIQALDVSHEQLMCDSPLNLWQALIVQIPNIPTRFEIDLYSLSQALDSHEQKRAFLICFLAVVETGLHLFQSELDSYCKKLSPYIHKYMESVDVSEYLKQLEAWYDINICYIQRTFLCLDQQISYLMFYAFLGKEVHLDGLKDEVKNDLRKFISCCSLADLFHEKKEDQRESGKNNSLKTDEKKVFVEANGDNYRLSSTDTTLFCNGCIDLLKRSLQISPIRMREVIENYKLRIIQDMNTFKRLIKEAETDFYVLYRAYVFLLSSGNAKILLNNAQVQCDDEEAKGSVTVLNVIQQFITDKMEFCKLDDQRRAMMKAKTLLRLLAS